MINHVSAAEEDGHDGLHPVRGTVSWLDLSAPDIDRAAAL